jgi:hypothetical protein
MGFLLRGGIAVGNVYRTTSHGPEAILDQVGCLDVLLRHLLAMTQQRRVQPAPNDLAAFLNRTIEPHRDSFPEAAKAAPVRTRARVG